MRHESLGIYMPKNQRERDYNDRKREKAEALRCRRFESIVNDRYDVFESYEKYVCLYSLVMSTMNYSSFGSWKCPAAKPRRGVQTTGRGETPVKMWW